MALIDSRRNILQAALELARADSAVTVSVRLQDAAAKAGLTTGAAYKHWTTQDEFRRDVAEFALRELGRSTPIKLAAAAIALLEVEAPMHEVIRVLGRIDYEEFIEDDDVRLTYSLLAAAARDTSLRAVAADVYARQRNEFRGLYEQLLAAYRLRLRAEYDIDDLSTALAATGDGFVFQSFFQPNIVGKKVTRRAGGDTHAKDWYLFACAVEAIVYHFTEPAG